MLLIYAITNRHTSLLGFIFNIHTVMSIIKYNNYALTIFKITLTTISHTTLKILYSNFLLPQQRIVQWIFCIWLLCLWNLVSIEKNPQTKQLTKWKKRKNPYDPHQYTYKNDCNMRAKIYNKILKSDKTLITDNKMNLIIIIQIQKFVWLLFTYTFLLQFLF